jgi:hypothetical protein
MAILDRRMLMAGALAATTVPALARAAVPPAGKLNFNILRQGKPFGRYGVVFVKDGETLTVTTDVAMSYKIAGISTFDYKHHCEEIWRGGKFVALHSRTVRDNRRDQIETVSAIREPYAIQITTSKSRFVVPVSAAPFTHWNSATLKGTLFNPQDGKRLEFAAQQVGRDPFPLASGAPIKAEHWMLRGDQQIDEWYDDSGVWAGLRGVFPDHSIVEYRRI